MQGQRADGCSYVFSVCDYIANRCHSVQGGIPWDCTELTTVKVLCHYRAQTPCHDAGKDIVGGDRWCGSLAVRCIL
jgi:hypothetical protein